MAEAEQALTTEVEAPASEKPETRQPRQLTEIIPSQLETLRGYHRAVLETEEVEAVHKLRVTTRRLQASLDLLEREMKVRKLKRRLRKWRRALSRVRNYDVFLQLIEKEAAGKRAARREQFELVKALLQERRVRKAAKVRQFLEGIDLDQMALKLGLSTSLNIEARESSEAEEQSEELSETTCKTLSLDEPKVAGYAAERLDQRLAEFQALVAQSHPTNDPAELHQLRIAAKRIRYLLEIVEEMGYGDASRALAWLRTLQDRIGDWHDLEALEEEIILMVSGREFMKQHLAESSTMLQAAAHLQKKKDALIARLFPVRVPKLLETTSRRIARGLRRGTPHQHSAVTASNE